VVIFKMSVMLGFLPWCFYSRSQSAHGWLCITRTAQPKHAETYILVLVILHQARCSKRQVLDVVYQGKTTVPLGDFTF